MVEEAKSGVDVAVSGAEVVDFLGPVCVGWVTEVVFLLWGVRVCGEE